MKKKLQLLLCWLITSIIIILAPQITLAYTYPTSRRSSSSYSLEWIILPVLLLVVGFAATMVVQRKKAGKGVTTGPPKVSSAVQEKLLHGESPLKEIMCGRADYVATDKRLLRFSVTGFEPLEYASISAINYKTSRSKKLAARVVIGLFQFTMTWTIILIWVFAFDSSVINVNVMDAIMVTIIGVVIFVICFFALSRDFGYYEIANKTAGKSKPWQINRSPEYLDNANIEDFIKTVKERITV